MTGLGLLVAMYLRRDRWHLLAWSAGIAGLWALSSLGLGASFSTSDLHGLAQLIGSNPALLMVRGAPSGDSLDAVIMVSLFSYTGVMAGLMATFLAVRHTRGDEDAGRAELIGSAPVSRLAPVAAAWCAGAIELMIVAALLGLAAFAAGGGDALGSLLLALGALGVGLTFLGIGIVAGQLMPASRGANGLAAAAVGAAFLMRGIGDATGTLDASGVHVASGAASWASPIGWAALAHPFATDPWAPDASPLALFPAAVLALGALTFAIAARRELGASAIPERSGPARGGASLGVPLGLAVRHQRGATIGWMVGASIGALAVGRMAPTVRDQATDNPMVQLILQVLGRTDGSVDIVDVFLFAFAGIIAIVASAAGMQAVLHVVALERTQGDVLFVTRPRRGAWLGAGVIVGIVSGLAVLAAFLFVAQASLTLAGEAGRWDSLFAIVLSLAPVVIVWVAVAALATAALPEAASWLSWLLLLGLMLLGEFSQLFGPDWDWLAKVSPFTWLANPLETAPDVWPTLWMLAGSLVVVGAAIMWFRRRDVRAG